MRLSHKILWFQICWNHSRNCCGAVRFFLDNVSVCTDLTMLSTPLTLLLVLWSLLLGEQVDDSIVAAKTTVVEEATTNDNVEEDIQEEEEEEVKEITFMKSLASATKTMIGMQFCRFVLIFCLQKKTHWMDKGVAWQMTFLHWSKASGMELQLIQRCWCYWSMLMMILLLLDYDWTNDSGLEHCYCCFCWLIL